MNHLTVKVDGVKKQHDANKLAEKVSDFSSVRRTRTNKLDVWVYLHEGSQMIEDITMLMLDNGYIMDYTNGKTAYTFTPMEDN